MTRAELKEHCEKQIEMCEMLAKAKGENPCGKVYEEHKMILELLEQESVLDKIRAEIEQKARLNILGCRGNGKSIRYGLCMALDIIDKYLGGRSGEE